MDNSYETSGDEKYSSDDENDMHLAGVKKEDDASIILPRKYSSNDLYPTKKDPSCDPDWQLSAYWPVFVGNFRVEEWNAEKWPTQISNYFGYRGLLTRMIVFPQNKPDPSKKKKKREYSFAEYQKYAHLIDMLVYFTSKEDAERAVKTCHQDTYYGYRLNVLPGRTPLYYDNSRSILFSGVGSHLPLEYYIVKVLSKFGPIDFAARFPVDDVVVEFETTEGMLHALQNQMKWVPKEITEQTMKQRFVEATIMPDIELAIQKKSGFMDMRPSESVLQWLYERKRPPVNTAWMNYKRYLKTEIMKKKSKYHPHCKRRPRGAPRFSKETRINMCIEAANQIFEKYGISPICKEGIQKKVKQRAEQHRKEMKEKKQNKKNRSSAKNKFHAKIKAEPNISGTQPQHGTGKRGRRQRQKNKNSVFRKGKLDQQFEVDTMFGQPKMEHNDDTAFNFQRADIKMEHPNNDNPNFKFSNDRRAMKRSRLDSFGNGIGNARQSFDQHEDFPENAESAGSNNYGRRRDAYQRFDQQAGHSFGYPGNHSGMNRLMLDQLGNRPCSSQSGNARMDQRFVHRGGRSSVFKREDDRRETSWSDHHGQQTFNTHMEPNHLGSRGEQFGKDRYFGQREDYRYEPY